MNTRKLVVDLRSRVPAFRLPDDRAAQFTTATPGWTTYIVQADTDSSGDGSRSPSDESLREIADAEIYVGFGLPRPLWTAAKKLRWIQSASAGVASLLFPEMVASDVALTNSAGIYGESIADHVVAGVLYFLRSFDVAGALQRRAEWGSAILERMRRRFARVNEVRVLVVGAGRNRDRGGAAIFCARRDRHRDPAQYCEGRSGGFSSCRVRGVARRRTSVGRRDRFDDTAHARDADAARRAAPRAASSRRHREQYRPWRADR